MHQSTCVYGALNNNFFNCIPKNQGYYGLCTVIIRVHVHVRRYFLVFNLQATFLFGFRLNFASDHPIRLVSQELKLWSQKF